MNQSTVGLRRLGNLILKHSSNELYWPWLQREDGTVLQPLSKRNANKFILGCIIDYQVYADRAWRNAARLAETELGDPPDLWETIGNLAESAWIARRKKYLWLHPLTAAHMRVWRIGRGIRDKYGGDARRIWRGQAPEGVRCRLNELRLGPQLSRMAIGALIDTGHLTGSGDLKADLHVRRVLGRLLRGSALSPDEATKVARLIYPMNPWKLDSSIYGHGKNICRAIPRCNNCPLHKECRFFKGKRAVI